MGIKGLFKLISDGAPQAIKEQEIKSYFGRKVAVDASMSLYQFLVAVRTGPNDQMLTNEDGEVTSHLQGMFYRTIRMIDNGIKPVYVFDGKPPSLKSGELEKRKERRDKATEELKAAEADENQEDINKFNRRLVRVTKQHNDDVKKLLRLMGVPVVEAPCEAEATCAALCKAGLVYAAATEDMDVLTFGTPKMVRHMTVSAARKLPIVEIDLAKVLDGLELTMDEFIDLCILCGCDYTTSIKGVGPKGAYKMIKEHKTLETGLKNLSEKYTVPEEFLYKEAAILFKDPEVVDVANTELKWTEPDEEAIVQFLCHEKGFQEDRIRGSIKKLRAARGKGSQKRLDSFFSVKPTAASAKRKKPTPTKKKATLKKNKK